MLNLENNWDARVLSKYRNCSCITGLEPEIARPGKKKMERASVPIFDDIQCGIFFRFIPSDAFRVFPLFLLLVPILHPYSCLFVFAIRVFCYPARHVARLHVLAGVVSTLLTSPMSPDPPSVCHVGST
jgi:hypothetical protein